MALLALPMRSQTIPLVLVLALLLGARCVFAHNGEPPPGPPRAPVETSTTQIFPPRWSWLHWWEANRDRYLISPSQDDALQPASPEQLAALRAEAARELLKVLEGNGRASVFVEAAMALGKMRHEAALPVLKTLAANGDAPPVRRAAILAIGLLSSEAAENDLGSLSTNRLDERIAGLVAIGLLEDLQAPTLRRLRELVAGRGAMARETDSIAISSIITWSLRHHRKDDNLNYFRNLLSTSESPWVASEALLGLGGTKDHAAQRLLEETMFGTPMRGVRAFEHMEEMHKRKVEFAGTAGTFDIGRANRRGAAPADERYEDYVKRHNDYWKNSPNPPKAQGRSSVELEIGPELISMAWLRSSAAIALGELDAPRAGDALLRFINENPAKEPYLVAPMGFAIMSLAAYPSDASRDRFIAILGKQDQRGKLIVDVTKDSPLRGFAALALGLYARPYDTPQGPADRPGFDWAITTLAERLEDEREEEEVRTACAVALGLTQRTAVLPVLHRLSVKIEQRNRRADFPVLGFVMLGRAMAGDRNLVEPAARLLLDRDDDTTPSGILSRRAVVLALGLTRSSTAIPILTKAWHLNHYVNREVILALRLVGGANAASPVMERLRQAKDQEERAYMAQALGELLAVDRPTALSRLTVGSNYTVRNDHFLPIQSLANGFLFDYLIASFGENW